jgi:IS30 family transposase
MPIPVKDQFSEIQKQQVQQMFHAGKTRAEIGQVLGKPPRTIGKLLSALGLKRDRAEAASLKVKSPLDNHEMITTIEALRKDHNLAQIAEKLGASASAVHRVCKKYNITLPDDYKQQQSDRIKKALSLQRKHAHG